MRKADLERCFREFCKNLSEKDTVAIVHHSDADGFCSALITAKAVEKLTGKKPAVVTPLEYGNRKQTENALKLIKKEKANVLAVVDLGIDSHPYHIEKRFPFEKALIIDHHKMYKDLNSKKTVFLKSQFFTKKDPSTYVTSKFAFDLFHEVADIQETDWIACIGILGDKSLGHWQPFVKETIRKRNITLTKLYSALDLIGAVEVLVPNRMAELFWHFFNAKSLGEALKSPFQEYLAEFKEEKDQLLESFEEKSERFPEIELFFYAIRPKHENIKSYVINEISEIHPDKTIILIQYLGIGRVRFSARRQDGMVKVNDLLVEAIKGLKAGSAGGHAPAAAGSILRKDLNKFKENVIRILRKQYGKG